MATVILSHKVENYEKWRPIYDADIKRRTEYGMTNDRVFRAADDSNNIYIIADVADPAIMVKLSEDADLVEKMKEGGVISQPIVTVLNQV
jgi:hypothetical protein